MAGHLSAEQAERYRRDGFLFPVRVLTRAEAEGYKVKLEAYERAAGGPISGNRRHKVHLLFTWAAELVRNPAILDAVESVLGPDLMVWGTDFFIKEPRDPGFVSWHQDSTYWGLDPADIVTAWVAFSDAPVESGAMKFMPGSHLIDQLPHVDTFHEHNLLTRGQEIAVEVDEKDAVDVTLAPGEMSLHHHKIFHASKANRSTERRIGLALRYIPTHVRQVAIDNDSAALVRGVDEYGHFRPEPRPERDLDPAMLALQEAAAQNQARILYSGTGRPTFRPDL